MRFRLGDLFRVRRATLSYSREGGARGKSQSAAESATYSILFLPPTPLSAPWVVVSEYRASLQQRMNPKQEQCTFESLPPPDAGGKGALPDYTPEPTPTPTEVRACFGQVAGPSQYQCVHTTEFLGWPLVVPAASQASPSLKFLIAVMMIATPCFIECFLCCSKSFQILTP